MDLHYDIAAHERTRWSLKGVDGPTRLGGERDGEAVVEGGILPSARGDSEAPTLVAGGDAAATDIVQDDDETNA